MEKYSQFGNILFSRSGVKCLNLLGIESMVMILLCMHIDFS